MENLLVSQIEKFAIHDGPGIRTVVFLKGCPMHCRWCSNPETQCFLPEMELNREKCVLCGKCIEACPNGAITIKQGGKITNDRNNCTNCGNCISSCIYYARKMIGKTYTTQELLKECLKDYVAYKRSGGGITVSGGEATSQAKGLVEFLAKCKQHRLHTAIESAACADWTVMDEVSNYLDLMMIDIKHMDSKIHEKFTGIPNEKILSNITGLSKKGIPIVLSLPLIPGVNDDKDNIIRTAEFAAGLDNIRRIRVLPYHRLGLPKYQSLDREYEMAEVEPQSKEFVEEIKTIIESKGIEVSVGF